MKLKLTFFASLILLAVACQNANTNATDAAAKATADSLAAAKVTDSIAAAAMAATKDTMKMDTSAHAMAATAMADTTAHASAVFACTMHPEVTGKKGDKCSKCKMALVAKVDAKKAK